ncbi:MAG: DDE-type integrase/transposase/recombinase [Nitrososphaerales archaeon]
MNPDFRQVNGESIARHFGWVRRIDETSYKVHSQREDLEYDVVAGEMGWVCSCPDSLFRATKCKHVWAVELSYKIRQMVRETVSIEPVNSMACPSCKSENVVKHGVRHNDAGDIQRFFCKDCRKWFVVNLGFEGMRATPQAITQAMQLYFSGESLRSVQKFLRLAGVNVSHVSVYKWIGKYVGLMEKYLDRLTPNVSDTWRADEIFVKFRGNMKFVFAMMDDETRFWIAKQVTDTKFTADVQPLFAEGKRVAGKSPMTLITDGGMHFTKPFKKEFYHSYAPQAKHIRDIRISGAVHNNKMERLNGELRDREKVMRGLKKVDTPILTGYQLYHNYIRPHEALGGETPADRAGIKVQGKNKWLTIIQNASQDS